MLKSSMKYEYIAILDLDEVLGFDISYYGEIEKAIASVHSQLPKGRKSNVSHLLYIYRFFSHQFGHMVKILYFLHSFGSNIAIFCRYVLRYLIYTVLRHSSG